MGTTVIEPGSTFGRLTVIERIPAKPYGKVHWRCQCACGQITIARDDHLRRGDSLSCGCRSRVDLQGQRIGELLVLERADHIQVGGRWLTAWLCRCACGRRVVVGTHLLQQPKPTSDCGCRSLRPAVPEIPSAAAPSPVADERGPALRVRDPRPTSAGEALRRFHDERAPFTVRRVIRSVPVEPDYDPYA